MRTHLFFLSFILLTISMLSVAEDAKPTESWSHESQIAVAAASGNSDSQTYQAKQLTTYSWDLNALKLGAHYLYGLSTGIESAKNWDGSLRYEHYLSEVLGVYVGNTWEGDIFVGYDYRTSIDAGARYYLVENDKKVNYLVTELGYRYMYENHLGGVVPPNLTSDFIRIYGEGVLKITDTASAKAWVELLPDLANGNNFQTNFEVSLSVAMNAIFSLKAAYLGKFRNQPITASKKNYDSLVTGALIAKF